MAVDRIRRWHCRNLGDAMLAAPLLEELQAEFEAALSAGMATGAGLFMRHESAGQLHCEVKLYFSPAAEPVAKTLGATLCSRPGKDGLSLLAGDALAWSEL